MTWTLTSDLDAYEAHTAALLARDAVRTTLTQTIGAMVRSRGLTAFGAEPARFGWFTGPGGEVEAALIQTPPFPAVLTALPPGAAESLGPALADAGWQLGGVHAPLACAEAFAAAYGKLTGMSWHRAEHVRLYRLGELRDPDPMPSGAARLARAADTDLVFGWERDFAVETRLNPPRRDAVEGSIALGWILLWEDGAPVSLACARPPANGAVRIGPVYTPPAARRRGYAGAATAAMSRLARERGADEVLLFTDLANPTSNALYQRLGYVPVEDRARIDFEA